MERVEGSLYEQVVQVCEERFDTILLSTFMQQQEAIVCEGGPPALVSFRCE